MEATIGYATRMEFSDDERSPYPREHVYAAHRDELEAVVAGLAEVRRVELRSRAVQADGSIEQMHHWFGSPSALPLLVRPFVREDLLVWTQSTVWTQTEWRARWVIEVPGVGDAVSCRGEHAYEEDGVGTRISVRGSFEFDPTRSSTLASVPASAVPMVERMVVSLIVPMIKRSGAAVSDYLSGRAE